MRFRSDPGGDGAVSISLAGKVVIVASELHCMSSGPELFHPVSNLFPCSISVNIELYFVQSIAFLCRATRSEGSMFVSQAPGGIPLTHCTVDLSLCVVAIESFWKVFELNSLFVQTHSQPFIKMIHIACYCMSCSCRVNSCNAIVISIPMLINFVWQRRLLGKLLI